MAKYILSGGTSQFFGSRGGATFQKCGKVFAIRKRSVIVQKRSAKQSQAKNLFASKAQNWRKPSFINKASYNNRANMYTRVNSLGNNYNMTGQQMQVGTNCIRTITNRADLTVVAAPASFVSISEDTFSLDISSVAFDLVILPVTVASGFDIQVFASAPMSGGLQPQSVALTNIGSYLQNQNTTSQNWYTRYTNRFGSVAGSAGLFIYIRMDLIQNNSGQVRQQIFGFADITP